MLPGKLMAKIAKTPQLTNGHSAKWPQNGTSNHSNKRKFVNNKIENGNVKKQKKTYKNKVLTAEEINELRKSNCLTNENIFAMQIEEILKATNLNDKHKKCINSWTAELETFLSKLHSDSEKLPSTELKWLKKQNCKIPLNVADLNVPEFNFQFIAPKSIKVIGSYKLNTLVGPTYAVDVAIEMPAECFQKENYLNLIYHQKKALYLSYLAIKLKNWNQVADCAFSFFHNDKFNPVLEIRPANATSKHIKFIIQLHCERNSFKWTRFVPQTSNVRGGLFNEDSSEVVPTPHYNSSILRDLTLLQNEDFLEKTLALQDNVKKALVLLKLWLRSKGLDSGYFGFNGYVLSMFAAYLVRKKKITIAMSVYDVLRNFWINLGKFILQLHLFYKKLFN